MNQPAQASSVRTAIEIAVNLSLIILIFAWCLQIISPFVSVIVWGAVIAIASYKLFQKLEGAVGGNRKLAVTLFLVAGLGLVIGPAWMFGGSMLESVQSFHESVETGSFDVPPPNESVKEWPLVGEKLYAAWADAAGDFEEFLEDYSAQLKTISERALAKAANMGVALLMFIFSTLIAGVFLANAEKTAAAMLRFCQRLVGDRGQQMLDLSVATIRSVTMGVLGIAFIQAVLLGGGMMVVGVPATGLWALLVLILVIAQLPALIIMAPIIAWVFSVESTTTAIIFAIYAVAASMSDIVLKPMLLGRGVDAPMLVVLLGAIGGMIMSGIIGLFVGAVVLTLGYKLFQAWLEIGEPNKDDAPPISAES